MYQAFTGFAKIAIEYLAHETGNMAAEYFI